LKGGLNYQYIAFKNCQRITLEKKFNAVELFMEILKDEKNWKQSLGSIMLIWLQVFNLLKTIVNNGLTECKPNLVINSLIDYLTFMEPEVILLHYCRRVYLNEIGLRLKWNLFDKPIFELK
jgi:hypothetical protein